MYCADCGMRVGDDKVTHCPVCGEAVRTECDCGCVVDFKCNCDKEASEPSCGEEGE